MKIKVGEGREKLKINNKAKALNEIPQDILELKFGEAIRAERINKAKAKLYQTNARAQIYRRSRTYGGERRSIAWPSANGKSPKFVAAP